MHFEWFGFFLAIVSVRLEILESGDEWSFQRFSMRCSSISANYGRRRDKNYEMFRFKISVCNEKPVCRCIREVTHTLTSAHTHTSKHTRRKVVKIPPDLVWFVHKCDNDGKNSVRKLSEWMNLWQMQLPQRPSINHLVLMMLNGHYLVRAEAPNWIFATTTTTNQNRIHFILFFSQSFRSSLVAFPVFRIDCAIQKRSFYWPIKRSISIRLTNL